MNVGKVFSNTFMSCGAATRIENEHFVAVALMK
jgi:hypothetical protein